MGFRNLQEKLEKYYSCIILIVRFASCSPHPTQPKKKSGLVDPELVVGSGNQKYHYQFSRDLSKPSEVLNLKSVKIGSFLHLGSSF